MKEIKFCAELQQTKTPFITIGIDDKQVYSNACRYGLYWQCNILLRIWKLKDMFSETDKQMPVFGIEGEETILNIISAEFYICGVKQQMEFHINNSKTGELISKYVKLPVCGIIGSGYMKEHGWIIDYADQVILISKE